MKKIFFTGIICLFTTWLFAQRADSVKSTIQKNAEAIGHGGNNEFKVNMLYAILGMPEISYERLLGDDMGLGISAFMNLEPDNDYTYGIIPHWRIYFGQKKAAGFFIEANTAVLGIKDTRGYDYIYPAIYPPYTQSQPIQTFTKFGLGAAFGAKFLARKGFLGEVYSGIGRVFGRDHRIFAVYPRGGITIGKRF